MLLGRRDKDSIYNLNLAQGNSCLRRGRMEARLGPAICAGHDGAVGALPTPRACEVRLRAAARRYLARRTLRKVKLSRTAKWADRKIGWPRKLLSSSGATALQTACKPDSVVDDHSSRRRVTTPLQQPTRGFRPPVTRISPPWRIGPIRSCPPGECGRDPCLFGLAPCGVYHAAPIAGRPVRSYRTFSPLPPAVCSDRLAPTVRSGAVYSLLHWPSSRLYATVPDVIRHTALRSPDFPPPPNGEPREAAIIQPPARSIVRQRVAVA